MSRDNREGVVKHQFSISSCISSLHQNLKRRRSNARATKRNQQKMQHSRRSQKKGNVLDPEQFMSRILCLARKRRRQSHGHQPNGRTSTILWAPQCLFLQIMSGEHPQKNPHILLILWLQQTSKAALPNLDVDLHLAKTTIQVFLELVSPRYLNLGMRINDFRARITLHQQLVVILNRHSILHVKAQPLHRP